MFNPERPYGIQVSTWTYIMRLSYYILYMKKYFSKTCSQSANFSRSLQNWPSTVNNSLDKETKKLLRFFQNIRQVATLKMNNLIPRRADLNIFC